METAIQVVWWIGLAGALIPTLVILKQVTLVVRALQDIHQLAGFTHDAARGIAENVAAVPRLAGADERARVLREAAAALGSAVRSIEQKLDSLAAGRLPREA